MQNKNWMDKKTIFINVITVS